jgi:uncharacterized protein
MKKNFNNILTKNQLMALEDIKTRINEIFEIENISIYGSIARGDDDNESDIDLLILTTNKLSRKLRHRITDIVFEVNIDYETNFSTFVVDIDAWENGVYSVLPIYNEIEREGVLYEY